jgi:hypothetical protein
VAPIVFGEVRVIKELLDRDVLGQQHTSTFCAGELNHPMQLNEALESSDYLADSRRAADSTITNCAYRPLREALLGAPVSGMIEIPVTLDDSMGYLTPATVDKAVARWTDIVSGNAENHKINCFMVHPNDTTYKVTAEERLRQACRYKPHLDRQRHAIRSVRTCPRRYPRQTFACDDHMEIRLNQPRVRSLRFRPAR